MYGLFLLVTAIIAYNVWKYYKEKEEDAEADSPIVGQKDETMEAPVNSPNYDGMKTLQLVETVAKNIGCHINLAQEDTDRVHVSYQGEHFTVICSDDSPYINIYDVSWYSAPLDDIDNLSHIRQAVNMCNHRNRATVLYTIENDENCINVHTRQCTIFGTYIPHIEEYLRACFEDSFRQHHNFYDCMEEIRRKEFARK